MGELLTQAVSPPVPRHLQRNWEPMGRLEEQPSRLSGWEASAAGTALRHQPEPQESKPSVPNSTTQNEQSWRPGKEGARQRTTSPGS